MMDNLVALNIANFINKTGVSGWTGMNAPDELQSCSGLWVTKAGARSFPGGFYYNPDKDSHWEWGAIIEGELEFNYGGKLIKAGRGSSYIMPSDIALTASASEIPFIVWLEAAGPNVGEAFKKIGGYPGELVISKYTQDQVKNVFKIARLLHDHPYGYGLNVHANLWSFIAGLVNPGSSETRTFSPEIRYMLDYLEEHSTPGSLTLDMLAAVSGLSRETFRKRFTVETGESPIKFVLKLQIRKAKELLSHKEMNIKEVAALAGFEDQYYFSRLFRKYEGLSPVQFRHRFYPELFL